MTRALKEAVRAVMETIPPWWRLPLSRISLKLSLTLIIGGFVIFGAYGAYELHMERGELLRAAERETLLLGHSLQAVVENAMRDRQLSDIEETLTRLEHFAPSIGITIYDGQGRPLFPAGRTTSVDPHCAVILQQAQQTREAVLISMPRSDPQELALAVPIRDGKGDALGGLLVLRPLSDVQQTLHDLRNGIISSVVLFALMTATLGPILGLFYISRPLSRLATAMKEVRSGNLASALPTKRKDEMSAITGEFNAMVTDLREARQRLEEEAESRRHLQHVLQEADKLITIGQLSAGLAHEIGSPLQILQGRARALFAHPADPAKVQRNAEILITQTERITRIVEQLLRFARRRSASSVKADLRTAITSVLDLMEHEAQRREVRLTLTGAEQFDHLQVDADSIQQIVLNLVANALAATPRDGQITVSLAHIAMLMVNGEADIPAVRLVVADTGCGMSEDVQRQLFKPFFTTRADEGGTGLGLAVVKSLVAEQNGILAVESSPGAGSRFTVDLPIHPTHPAHAVTHTIHAAQSKPFPQKEARQ